jgi:hypothetical protein
MGNKKHSSREHPCQSKLRIFDGINGIYGITKLAEFSNRKDREAII